MNTMQLNLLRECVEGEERTSAEQFDSRFAPNFPALCIYRSREAVFRTRGNPRIDSPVVPENGKSPEFLSCFIWLARLK